MASGSGTRRWGLVNSYSGDPAAGKANYEVGVAVVSTDSSQERELGSVPGYEDLRGTGRGALLIKKGEQFVNDATEALASQIARSADQIAKAINEQIPPISRPGHMDLESLEVSFGVTLTTGVQALFTAQGDSSVVVTITLRRGNESQSPATSKATK
jgi:hypothetical protein